MIESHHEKTRFIAKIRVCENKGTDQMCGNRITDLQLRFTNNTIRFLPKSKPLAIFCGYAVRFVLDLVENLKGHFLTSQL